MANTTIGIIGSGTMGGGIAQMFAEKGFKVLLWDADENCLNKGIENIQKRLSKSVEKENMTKEASEKIISLIAKANSLEDFSEANIVIEAIIENREIKTRLYNDIEKVVSNETIIGSNTSSISIEELATNLQNPERFLGVHFFNPPTKLDLVEIISHPALEKDTKQKVIKLLAECGKTTVSVKDSPGFIVNRLLLPLINEAAKLVDEDVAAVEEIDIAMRLGTLHPAGPLQVADLIGLDICKDILEKLVEKTGRADYAPAESIKTRVAAGKLGRKTGEGFYGYQK